MKQGSFKTQTETVQSTTGFLPYLHVYFYVLRTRVCTCTHTVRRAQTPPGVGSLLPWNRFQRASMWSASWARGLAPAHGRRCIRGRVRVEIRPCTCSLTWAGPDLAKAPGDSSTTALLDPHQTRTTSPAWVVFVVQGTRNLEAAAPPPRHLFFISIQL